MINDQITSPRVRLISSEGEQLGVVDLQTAFDKADEADMDLVLISNNGREPVCKIMDYGKYRFEQSKRLKEQRKNQQIVQIKEIQLSYTIQEHDLEVKYKKAHKFLTDGNKVKFTLTVMYSRGQGRINPQVGFDLLNNFAQRLSEISVIDKPAVKNGKKFLMVLAPKNNKK